ncbi:competence/damage-inducible protein A [Cuneatibacter caecimuris]|uniref:Putative competence-damage inducible protein n=1 Tax=Cuneatibacter caecimuris TaxID=1796618 RepID=A0A4Q7P022_9FIRM|nr:competence/damage-inducible protein A [Cuneatibacter caecimuris]RZS92877.1 nicotinamide-nucleotide amidase [Cuneatibacter caecimuris]
MAVELIFVGTELLLGNILNTNAKYLSERCALSGLSVYYQSVVGDNEERLAETIRTGLNRSDILILSGGLGPTEDDLTKETAAKVLGLPMVEDPHTKELLKQYFAKLKQKNVTESNWKQALVPEGAVVLDNDNGTAPGLILEKDGKTIVLLPGPPAELIPLFEKKVEPYLCSKQPETIRSTMVKICGVGESKVEDMIKDMIAGQDNPTIAPYAKTGEVHLRVTARAQSEDEAKKLMKPVVKELKSRFGNHIYTTKEQDTLEQVVVDMLKKYELTLTTAESCTGGLLAARLINIPGVSEVFKSGFITYSNKAKRKLLGVNKNTLKKYGAVSEETAHEMAKGCVFETDSLAALAITGIAGPDGGTDDKPVGLVYISCYLNDQVVVKECRFKGDRNKIREQAVVRAMDLLRRCIIDHFETKK